TVVEVNIANNTQTRIANGGSRGDFVHVDSNDGSVLLTQSDRVVRLKFPAGPATSFRVDATTSVLAGKPFGFGLTALDAYGAVAPASSGRVPFPSSPVSPGQLPSDYTFPPGDKGSHIFGAAFFAAGSQTLAAKDTPDGSIPASAAVAVFAAPASH